MAKGHNGSISSDSVKYEPSSPVSPNCSAASPIEIRKNETIQNEADGSLCMPYLNGCTYPPAFPYSGSIADTVPGNVFVNRSH
ncbi:UNVERIFIED_CONTAM: hypothetical protein NCL1_14060 [Trichonephila clavipes]